MCLYFSQVIKYHAGQKINRKMEIFPKDYEVCARVCESDRERE